MEYFYGILRVSEWRPILFVSAGFVVSHPKNQQCSRLFIGAAVLFNWELLVLTGDCWLRQAILGVGTEYGRGFMPVLGAWKNYARNLSITCTHENFII